MSAYDKTFVLQSRLNRAGINADFAQAETLRRAQLTLHRWAELECGNDYGCIEREESDPDGGRPFWRYSNGKRGAYMADREHGALRRVAAVCKALGCHYYHQTDPRGCALYVSAEPIQDHNYTRGVACSV